MFTVVISLFSVVISDLSFHCRQELETRLAFQEEDIAIVKTVKSEVARLPDMEKELKRLREDNAFLRFIRFLHFK